MSRSNECWSLVLLLTAIVLTATGCQRQEPVSGSSGQIAVDAGAKLLEERCSVCHSADRPKRAHKSAQQWQETVSRMVGKGARLSAEEERILVAYLARQYGE